MKEVVIVGARGMARELIGYLEEHGDLRLLCLLDDGPSEEVGEELLGYPVMHPDRYRHACRAAILAVAYPQDKAAVLERFAPLGLTWIRFVHPSANVSSRATLGPGCVVAPLAVITGDARLSSFVWMNSFSAVGHEAYVADRCSLMPQALVGGQARIGEGSLLSMGAMVLPGVAIGPRCRVSAGAVVTRDMPGDSLLFGNPARSSPDLAMLRKSRNQQTQRGSAANGASSDSTVTSAPDRDRDRERA